MRERNGDVHCELPKVKEGAREGEIAQCGMTEESSETRWPLSVLAFRSEEFFLSGGGLGRDPVA